MMKVFPRLSRTKEKMPSLRSGHTRWVTLALLLACPASLVPRSARAADPSPDRARDLFPSRHINRKLPDWIRLSGEFRTRAEDHTGVDFQRGADQAYVLTRFRVNLDFQPRAWFHAFVQGQDARVAGVDVPLGNTGLKDIFDLR
jgi:hypothetical protein